MFITTTRSFSLSLKIEQAIGECRELFRVLIFRSVRNNIIDIHANIDIYIRVARYLLPGQMLLDAIIFLKVKCNTRLLFHRSLQSH